MVRDMFARRSVLRAIAGAPVIGIGIAAAAGGAGARGGQGGSGIIAPHTWEAHLEYGRFKITRKVNEQDFTCRGTERTWACYGITFDGQAPSSTHRLFVNPRRRIDTTEEGPYPKGRGYEQQDGYTGWHEFTSRNHVCLHYNGGMTVGREEQDDAVKVSFKPTDNA